MTPPPLPVTLDTGDAPRLIDGRTPGESETAHIPAMNDDHPGRVVSQG
ncbi:hypothetical protein [Actinomadura spongiicola]|nr:hypothetical protein [Actinomadura spongiicola]